MASETETDRTDERRVEQFSFFFSCGLGLGLEGGFWGEGRDDLFCSLYRAGIGVYTLDFWNVRRTLECNRSSSSRWNRSDND